MKFAAFGKLPWDMVVFLSITITGLGVSFKRLAYPEKIGSLAAIEESAVVSGVVDLGCIDRRSSHQRLNFTGVTVKVKGQLCDLSRKQSLGVGGIQIRNITSREEGTVFLQGSHSKFVSGELALGRGKNTVQVEWLDPVTGKEKTLTTELLEN